MNTISHTLSSTTELTPKIDSTQLAKTKTLLVSVIIPVYNGSKYIQIAIDSVLSQTYKNYEIIVVDDGSTDDTRQKLHVYHEQIRYIFQDNRGSAAARNLGIKLAKGEFIAFLDSDDFWSMPEKLEKQVAHFHEHPSLGGINTGWKIVDGAGKHIKTVQPWHKAPKLDLETWLKKKCVRTSAMIFRRQWLEQVGGFDEELRQSHDVDLILRLSLAGCETGWLKEETVCYRQHELNTTKDSLKQARYIQAVLDKFFARNDLPESINNKERQVRYHTLVWIAWYQYNADNLDGMTKFLAQSLDFSPYLRVENISHWLSSFKRFSQERGHEFDADSLTGSRQWEKSINTTLGLNDIVENHMQEKHQDNLEGSSHDSKCVKSKKFQVIDFNIKSASQETSKQIRNKLNNKNLLETKKYQSNDKIKQDNPQNIIKGKKENILPIEDTTNTYYSHESNRQKASVSKVVKPNSVLKDNKKNTQSSNQLEQNAFSSSYDFTSKDLKINLDLAEGLYKQSKFEESIKYYIKAIQIQPDKNWNTHHKLGCAYFKNKMWKESVFEFQESINLNSNFVWSYYNLGRSLEKIEQYDKSITSYLTALEISFKPEVKRDLEKLLEYLILSKEKQKLAKSLSSRNHNELIKIKQNLLVKEIEFQSIQLQKYLESGDLLCKNNQLNEAIDCFYQASRIQPNSWNIHQKISHVLFKQKRWQDSIIECHEVIKLKPDFLWSYYNLARNLSQIGNWREAIQYYLKALKISDKSEIKRDLELLLDEKINYYQEKLQDGLENLLTYQELLDLKVKVKVMEGKKQKFRTEQLLKGFSKKIIKKKKVVCLMFGMERADYIESVSFVLHKMYMNKIYPIVLTDSLQTELLVKNNVIFEYFPLSEKPCKFSDLEWKQYFKGRVINIVKEWSPQQVLNFNNTWNKELSKVILSII